MLLQLEETQKDDVEKLMSFARQNNLKLSLVDESYINHVLPGKPLSENELKDLIQNSRSSGVISMKNAHNIIRDSYVAD